MSVRMPFDRRIVSLPSRWPIALLTLLLVVATRRESPGQSFGAPSAETPNAAAPTFGSSLFSAPSFGSSTLEGPSADDPSRGVSVGSLSGQPWNDSPMSFDPFVPFDSVVTDPTASDAPIERFKRGFFQRLDFGGGIVLPFEDDVTMSHAETGVAVAVPLGNLENILVVNPTYRIDFWSSNVTFELPTELHQAGVNLLYRRQWNDRWTTMVLVTPSIRSDFRESEPDIRYFGLGVVQYQWIPETLQVTAGAVFLGRDDLPPVLPAVGLVWTPTPLWNFDLMFPRPRIAYRLAKEGDRSETWAYVSGALGGNTWTTLRASGNEDELSARDYRAMFGIERVLKGGGGVFVETGYVFGRQIEYEIGGEKLDLSDGWMIQGGFRF